MKLLANTKLITVAKNLRKNMTNEKRHLWYDFLSDYQCKFYRQKIIGNYIADFYCSKAKLVIEIDGSQHYGKENIYKDSERTNFFNKLSLKVIRFTNSEINTNFAGVCEYIDRIVLGRLK